MSKKEMHPRFRCVLCGMMVHYSQLEKSPYPSDMFGMYNKGYAKPQYKKLGRKASSEYRKFLCEKIAEIIDDFKIVDEVQENLEELGWEFRYRSEEEYQEEFEEEDEEEFEFEEEEEEEEYQEVFAEDLQEAQTEGFVIYGEGEAEYIGGSEAEAATIRSVLKDGFRYLFR